MPMVDAEINPLAAAIAAGLTLPIHARLVSANGTKTEILFESETEFHTLSLQLPIDFPIEWTLTGANRLTAKFLQTAGNADELLDRVQKRIN
jgi:hypothetical protein